jgi:polyisoprenoid-binding protein YceI
MKHFFASVLALYLFVGSACYGASYAIDYAQSRIGFSGTHAEADFSGTFGRWNGKIIFDPDDLPASSIHVEIEMPSAVTGNPMFDGTLPNEDWFKVKEYPKAIPPKARFK